jgi:hypothetical protein
VALTPAFASVSALLVLSGAMKLRAPAAASGALRTMSVPAATTPVRLAAACEIALGAWALASPGRLSAGLVAAAYGGFAVFVAGLLRDRGRAAGCGCFGSAEAEVHPMHFVVNLVAAGVAVASVVSPPPGIAHVLAHHLAVGLVLCAGVAGAAYAAYLLYTAAPAAWRAYRREAA